MIYFKVDANTYIEYNPETKKSKTIFKDALQTDIDNMDRTSMPTNEELISWAKANHPQAIEAAKDKAAVNAMKDVLAALKDAKVV